MTNLLMWQIIAVISFSVSVMLLLWQLQYSTAIKAYRDREAEFEVSIEGLKSKVTELSKKPKKQESYECKELLQDLLSGDALVKVERIAPADFFLTSPRG